MSINRNNPAAVDIIHMLIKTTHSVQRDFTAQIAALDLPFKISGPRLRILATVAEVGVIRMNELASLLGIQARSLTDFVDALEKEELLVRHPDPTDRRATLIELTALANSHLNEALAKQTVIADELLQNLTVEDQKKLLELLLLLIDNEEDTKPCDEGPINQ